MASLFEADPQALNDLAWNQAIAHPGVGQVAGDEALVSQYQLDAGLFRRGGLGVLWGRVRRVGVDLVSAPWTRPMVDYFSRVAIESLRGMRAAPTRTSGDGHAH